MKKFIFIHHIENICDIIYRMYTWKNYFHVYTR